METEKIDLFKELGKYFQPLPQEKAHLIEDEDEICDDCQQQKCREEHMSNAELNEER